MIKNGVNMDEALTQITTSNVRETSYRDLSGKKRWTEFYTTTTENYYSPGIIQRKEVVDFKVNDGEKYMTNSIAQLFDQSGNVTSIQLSELNKFEKYYISLDSDFKDGLLNNSQEGQPAVIGSIEVLGYSKNRTASEMNGYFENGKLHREDGPAYLVKKMLAPSYVPAKEDYWRDENPYFESMAQYFPKDVHAPSSKATKYERYLRAVKECWSKNGLADRADGPALTRCDGSQEYYKNGLLHREDGPAIIHVSKYVTHIQEQNGIKKEIDQYWYKEGKIHRNDGPAIIYSNGDQVYYKEGQVHREDGPAKIFANGREEYYKNGLLDREDGPAIIENGIQSWYKNGKLHREDGPAIVNCNGAVKYYKNGQLDREEGPAFIDKEGNQKYYKEGKLHRDNGPAIIEIDGHQSYYKNGSLDIITIASNQLTKLREKFLGHAIESKNKNEIK
jgi:hypothetical protein